jgi:hypothetical protein
VRARLGIVWSTPEALDVRAAATATPALPADSLDALRQLGELGYVRGVLEKLDELDRLDTAYAPVTQALRNCVQRFDLQGFARVLEEGRA